MTASDNFNNNFPIGFGIRKTEEKDKTTEPQNDDICEECGGKLIVTQTGFQVCSACGLEHQLVHFTRF